MNLALFGATGGTGRCILEQALQNGNHSIRALVRDPGNLKVENHKLNIIQGNILERADVYKTISGTDGVLSALGNTGNNPSDLHTRGTQHVISAMKYHNVNRLVVLTTMGLGESRYQIPFCARLFTKIFLSELMADKRQQEELIEESNLDWTIIRPGGLVNSQKLMDVYRGNGTEIMAGPIARSEVARFMLDALTSSKYLREKPVITTKGNFDLDFLSSQFKQLFSHVFYR